MATLRIPGAATGFWLGCGRSLLGTFAVLPYEFADFVGMRVNESGQICNALAGQGNRFPCVEFAGNLVEVVADFDELVVGLVKGANFVIG